MLIENKKQLNLIYCIALSFIALGAILGAVYYIFSFWGETTALRQIESYILSLKMGMDIKSVVISSIKAYSLLFVTVYICSYIKLGYLISFFSIARRGFVNAFAATAMINVCGWRGVLMYLSNLPQAVILLPISALFVSVGYTYHKNKANYDKREKIIYIIFSIIVFTVFCVSALCEGLLTTTFMKWLVNKVT